MNDILHRAAAALSCLALVSCGGGGGGGAPAPSPAPSTACNSGASFEVSATTTPAVGKNVFAAVMGCAGAIGNPLWTQIAGTPVAALSDKTQTLSFDMPQAGSVVFRVAFSDPQGIARTQDLAFPVGVAVPASYLTLRVSQSVRMGGNVSVRAWPTLAAGDAVQSIAWTQTEGPVVTLDTTDSYAVRFVAPDVSRDTPIRLRATLRTANGVVDSDDALVLVERYVQAPASDADAVWSGDHVSRVYAYKAASPYAAALANCTYAANLHYRGASQNTCALTRLPFIAQEALPADGIPTVEQVMDRVVVSHDWLGRNFENFLRTQDAQGDFRRMLKSVTAVVLGTQVRPSFYYALTGAIYLDGDNFWLSPEERDTVNEAPDFRSDFGSALQYSDMWRYVQNNSSIFVAFNPRSRLTRDVAYLLNESGWLMYHELGHAQDFLPSSQYAGLNAALDPWGNIGPRYANRQLMSDSLRINFGLASSEMNGLAQVKFIGATANDTQRGYTPDQVAAFFSVDRATDEYNYSTQYEDLAMTLEEFLMHRRLGILRDKGITDKITANTTSANLIVRWGQRGRVGDANIKPRVRAIVQQLTPWIDTSFVDTLPAPIQMRPGESWSANLALPAPPHKAMALQEQLATREQIWRFNKELQRMEHHRHAQRKTLPPR